MAIGDVYGDDRSGTVSQWAEVHCVGCLQPARLYDSMNTSMNTHCGPMLPILASCDPGQSTTSCQADVGGQPRVAIAQAAAAVPSGLVQMYISSVPWLRASTTRILNDWGTGRQVAAYVFQALK